MLNSLDAALTPSGSVQLTWSTASENINNYFTIERSADGEWYEAVGDVPGSGTTKEPHYYGYEDRMPLAGRSYYRLKQTDFDGTSTYSRVVVIDNDVHLVPTLTVFPNPYDGKSVGIRLTGITGEARIPISIYAPAGRIVATMTLVGKGEDTLEKHWYPTAPLPPGVYLVRAGHLTEKLIVPED